MVKKKARLPVLNNKNLLDRKHPDISIARQCELLGLNRTSYYYKPRTFKLEEDIAYKQLILEEYLKCPFYGYRKITKALNKKEYEINKKRVLRLMQEIGIQAIYPKPNLSKPCSEHKKYPYLLRGLEVKRPNHVWAIDITYIKLPGGYIYLTAIIDLYSRKTLSWKISNTLDVDFCVEVLEEAINRYGKPEIFNSDQGSQFTSNAFLKNLEKRKIKISMDGKGRAIDNIYIERLWRSLKYEDIYIREYNTIKECVEGVDRYFNFYNSERFHQSLNYETPDEIYFRYKKPKKYKKAS